MPRSLVVAVGLVVFVCGASSAPADLMDAVRCKEAKAKATGKKAASLLESFGRNEKSPNPIRFALGISKVESKFTGSFSKTEARGGCPTSGDSDGIEAKVNAFVESVVAEISGVTTTTAATTTLPPITSTTTTGPSTTTTMLPPPCGVGSKCVFVTSQTWDGNLGGLSGADTKCGTAAENGLPWLLDKEFRAWLSDRGTSASMRLFHSTVPYRLVDGTLVANDWDDLVDGEVAHPIDITELNTAPLGTYYVWTGTNPDGATFFPLFPPSSLCMDWTVHWWDTLVGSASNADEHWTAYGRWLTDETMCGKQYHLYCLQQ